MRYVREVAGYVGIALVTVPLVLQIWLYYKGREILATGAGVTLGKHVAPSWRLLATRVRSGEVTLSREEQAKRLERTASFFESEAQYERERVAADVSIAQDLFRASLTFLILQIVLAVVVGIAAARSHRKLGQAPPNSA